MRNYGEYLKNERTIRKLSQEKLAKAIGVSQQAISFYENNINEPSISICEKIAAYYEISIDELIGRDYETEKTNKAVIYNHSTHNGNNNF